MTTGLHTRGFGPLSTAKATAGVAPATLLAAMQVYSADYSGTGTLPSSITGLATGSYMFVLSGKGVKLNNSPGNGGAGAMCILTLRVKDGDSIPVTFNAYVGGGGNGYAMTLTFPDGTVAAAGHGGDGDQSSGGVGRASGGDINLSAPAGSAIPPAYGAINGTGVGGYGGSVTQGGVASIIIVKVG